LQTPILFKREGGKLKVLLRFVMYGQSWLDSARLENGTAFAFKAKPGHRIQYTTAPATSSSSSSSSSSFSSTNSVLIGHYTYVDENTEMMEGGLGECQESGLRKEPGESGEGVVLTIGKDSECFYLSDIYVIHTCI